MTQDYLNREISLAKKILIYYTDKIATYLSVGSGKYIQWYIDSLQLYFLLNLLLNISLDSDKIYLGGEEIEEDTLHTTFNKVREYWTFLIDLGYDVGEIGDITEPTFIEPYQSDWKEFTVSIDINRITQFTLPVNVGEISDPEAVIVYVNDYGTPIPNVDTEENGYHITGSTFYWHNYYDLLVGDKVHVKYKQIKG